MYKILKSKKKIPITLVCATHNGYKKLPNLINSIFKNNLYPDEIVICGTSVKDISLVDKKYLNIIYIKSKIANQTYQRSMAISKARNDLIIQCDDDIILSNKFFEKIYSYFNNNKNKKIIVGANILLPNKKPLGYRWNYFFKNFFLFRLILLILNAGNKVKYMSVLKSGRISSRLPTYFFNNKTLNNRPIYTEWLTSTICFNKKYYFENFSCHKLVAKNKSYYEDVLFTHALYKKNFKLLLDINITAIHPFTLESNFFDYIKTIRTQNLIVKKFNKNYFLFFFDVIFFTLIYFIKYLLLLFKKMNISILVK